jgi:predicted kinase
MVYVNPDDFLGSPRVFTLERSLAAWRACKDLVETTLSNAQTPYSYYMVCGVQGSGKSWWVRQNSATFKEPAIVFDAAHARARDRAPAVAQARRFSCRMIAIWVSCPLDVALARNRSRPPDQVVSDEVVRLVFNTFEPPTVNEGFDEVLEVANV